MDNASVIEKNQLRARGSPPYNPKLYPDNPAAKPEHVWTSPYGLPICKYCGETSLRAQAINPETWGAGPCPKAP